MEISPVAFILIIISKPFLYYWLFSGCFDGKWASDGDIF